MYSRFLGFIFVKCFENNPNVFFCVNSGQKNSSSNVWLPTAMCPPTIWHLKSDKWYVFIIEDQTIRHVNITKTGSFIISEPVPKRGRKLREFTRPRITLEPLDKIADRDETSKLIS